MNHRFTLTLIVAFLFLLSCNQELVDMKPYNATDEPRTRSLIEGGSPFSETDMEFDFGNPRLSYKNGFTAINVPVKRQNTLCVSVADDSTKVRRIFQNLVVLSDSTGVERSRFIVSVLPDPSQRSGSHCK